MLNIVLHYTLKAQEFVQDVGIISIFARIF